MVTEFLASVKISGTHWKCIENFRATILIRTANCILTYGVDLGRGLALSPVKKTLNSQILYKQKNKTFEEHGPNANDASNDVTRHMQKNK